MVVATLANMRFSSVALMIFILSLSKRANSCDQTLPVVDLSAPDAAVNLVDAFQYWVIDRSGKVISEFDAGLVTLVGIDNKKDGELKMVDTIENVRREPDAVKWIDDDHFATANEVVDIESERQIIQSQFQR